MPRSPRSSLGTPVWRRAVSLFAVLPMLATACQRQTSETDTLSSTTVIDVTGAGLGEYVAQTMGGGRLANQYMPYVRTTTPDSLAAVEREIQQAVKDGKASGYLVLDGASLRGQSARYWGKRAKVKEEMELIRGAIRENVLALEMRRREIDPLLVDSLTARPVALDVREGD